MSFKWQDGHMALFLTTYQQHECLWNTKCSEYSKSNTREKAYLSMLKDLNIPGLTVTDIKAKIKTIRTRYVAELNKIKMSERDAKCSGEVYEPRLFWFKDADGFLRNVVCSQKPTLLKIHNSKQKETSPDKTATINQCLEKLEQQQTDIEDNEPASPENIINTSEATSPKYSPASLPSNKRKRSSNPSSKVIHEAIKKLKQISYTIKEDPNEFDVFCASLAIQLNKMPLHRAVICQEKLQSVMTQERLFQITESQQSVPLTSFAYRQSLSASNSAQNYMMASPTESDIHAFQPIETDEYTQEDQCTANIKEDPY